MGHVYVGIGASLTAATFNVGDPTAQASAYTATILWGDGSATSVGTVSGSGGVFTVNSVTGHVYLVDSIDATGGAYPVTVTLSKAGQTVQTAIHGVVVTRPSEAEQNGNVVEDSSGTVANQVVAAFEVPNNTDGVAEFAASINWGDGTSSVGVVSGSNGLFQIAGGHHYATAASHVLQVTLQQSWSDYRTTLVINSLAAIPARLVAPPLRSRIFQIDNTTNQITMKVQLKVVFLGTWTDAEKSDYKALVKKQIEDVWNVNPFRIYPTNSKGIPGGSKGLQPQLQITVVDTLDSNAKGYRVMVTRTTSKSRVRAKVMYTSFDAKDLTNVELEYTKGKKTSILKMQQSTLAHEFGHLIGLAHPGANYDPQFDPSDITGTLAGDEGGGTGTNRARAYFADPYSLMGAGNELRGGYFAQSAQWLAKEYPAAGQWTTKADPKHAVYATTQTHWKDFCRNRFTTTTWPPVKDYLKFDDTTK